MTDLITNNYLYGLIAASLIAVVLLIPVASYLAKSYGFVDQPGGRKQHDESIPPIGGLVVFPVFMIVLFLSGAGFQENWPLYTSLLILLTLGGIDDKFTVPAKYKFIAQISVAVIIVVFGSAKVTSLGDLFALGPFGLNLMSIPFSIVATVLLLNAINLLDGLDGLAAGIGWIAFAFLAVSGLLAGSIYGGQSLLMLTVLSGFLIYNLRTPFRKRASVFMGDSGSLCLGLCLAWYTMTMANYDVWVIEPMTVAWLLALPIFDICGQFARRIRLGKHPFSPDHFHFHHHFIKAGVSVGRAVFFIHLMCFSAGLYGVILPYLGVPTVFLTVPWIALLLVHIYMCLKPKRYQKLIKRFVS